MAVALDHTIVPARDRAAAARFLADLLGLQVGADQEPFTPVVLDGGVTLDFDSRTEPTVGHWAFRVDPETFEAALRPELTIGSGPEHGWDGRVSEEGAVRRVYVEAPDGHVYELITTR